jgi:phospholipase C
LELSPGAVRFQRLPAYILLTFDRTVGERQVAQFGAEEVTTDMTRRIATVDGNGYGLRVPGLVISPYARLGYIDHQTLSFDAYLKFIEDDFLGGQRIDPATDGRPDSRPDVRENASGLGDLTADFNFSQAPRPAIVLPTIPQTDLK